MWHNCLDTCVERRQVQLIFSTFVWLNDQWWFKHMWIIWTPYPKLFLADLFMYLFIFELHDVTQRLASRKSQHCHLQFSEFPFKVPYYRWIIWTIYHSRCFVSTRCFYFSQTVSSAMNSACWMVLNGWMFLLCCNNAQSSLHQLFTLSSPSPTCSSSLMCLSSMCPRRVVQTEECTVNNSSRKSTWQPSTSAECWT